MLRELSNLVLSVGAHKKGLTHIYLPSMQRPLLVAARLQASGGVGAAEHW